MLARRGYGGPWSQGFSPMVIDSCPIRGVSVMSLATDLNAIVKSHKSLAQGLTREPIGCRGPSGALQRCVSFGGSWSSCPFSTRFRAIFFFCLCCSQAVDWPWHVSCGLPREVACGRRVWDTAAHGTFNLLHSHAYVSVRLQFSCGQVVALLPTHHSILRPVIDDDGPASHAPRHFRRSQHHSSRRCPR